MLVKVLQLLALIVGLDCDVARYLVDISHYFCHVFNILLTIIDNLFIEVRFVLYLDVHRL